MDDRAMFAIALEEAKKGFAVGGLPIGACLVSQDGEILGRGHNKRVQEGSVIKHAEMSALESTIQDPAHPPPASVYRGATMFTTLVPCVMCTGACLLYGIGRVVYGTGADQSVAIDTLKLLEDHGVETVGLGVQECEEMMGRWIEENPARYRAEPWCTEA
ncbi:hypothetical protein LTR36_009608 [Oleoguttula mirabilis]|uniref:CMP/dCMP-type deaminase domain-containing protein n=1 Tax=Oleoguttula mirabilis TaxID=1507867 RepID=A0AAV9J6K3_9PEZI|nr:hypothetical protein LTR36_009608 [Oleoguttula mirabilis]